MLSLLDVFNLSVSEIRVVAANPTAPEKGLIQMARVRGACGNQVWRGVTPTLYGEFLQHGVRTRVIDKESYRGKYRLTIKLSD
jgi:hypothetical protein